MKRFLSCFLLLVTCFSLQAQDSTTVWIVSSQGDIYTLDFHTCSTRFVCATNRMLGDIAQTPNGKFWGSEGNTLFQIDTTTGNAVLVGAIPPSNSLVGLNDSILLVESAKDLYAVKNTDASAQLIGRIGYSGDGDLTWLGRNLYMFGEGYLVEIMLNDSFTQIISIDTLRNPVNPYNYSTAAMATAYRDSIGYSIVTIPVDSNLYVLDSINAGYSILCTRSTPLFAFGASSLVFPSNFTSVSVNEIKEPIVKLKTYPNPVEDVLYIELLNFKDKISEAELQLYDNIGRLLIRRKLQSNKEEIDLSDYVQGLYYLIVKYKNGGIQIRKVIK